MDCDIINELNRAGGYLLGPVRGLHSQPDLSSNPAHPAQWDIRISKDRLLPKLTEAVVSTQVSAHMLNAGNFHILL